MGITRKSYLKQRQPCVETLALLSHLSFGTHSLFTTYTLFHFLNPSFRYPKLHHFFFAVKLFLKFSCEFSKISIEFVFNLCIIGLWLILFHFRFLTVKSSETMSDDEREEKELDLTSPEVVTKYKSAAEIVNSKLSSSFTAPYM